MKNDPHAVRQQWKLQVEFDLETFSRENTFNHAGKFAVKIGEIASAKAKDIT